MCVSKCQYFKTSIFLIHKLKQKGGILFYPTHALQAKHASYSHNNFGKIRLKSQKTIESKI